MNKLMVYYQYRYIIQLKMIIYIKSSITKNSNCKNTITLLNSDYLISELLYYSYEVFLYGNPI